MAGPKHLSLHEFSEHLLRINGDENSLASRQDFPFIVENFGHVDVLAAMDGDFSALNAEWLIERDGLYIFDRHLFGECDNVA